MIECANARLFLDARRKIEDLGGCEGRGGYLKDKKERDCKGRRLRVLIALKFITSQNYQRCCFESSPRNSSP